MKNAALPVLCLLLLGACADSGPQVRRPTFTGNPSSMSAETLCFRGAYAKDNEAIQQEIRDRRVDCARLLENDPLAPER